jgi:hypothetical protein
VRSDVQPILSVHTLHIRKEKEDHLAPGNDPNSAGLDLRTDELIDWICNSLVLVMRYSLSSYGIDRVNR